MLALSYFDVLLKWRMQFLLDTSHPGCVCLASILPGYTNVMTNKGADVFLLCRQVLRFFNLY